MRNHRKTAAVALAALLLAAAPSAALAAPADSGTAPSACRPANHLAKVTPGPASAGHHHYRVTLTAPRGYASCVLAGPPADVRFSGHGDRTRITPGEYGDQRTAVTFGPGRPVHFDIQVPSGARQVAADEVSFTLRTPGGRIPGTSFAEGSLRVAAGTLVGPVRQGS
ncbi:DUF4232 domain-containing protein [Streptomyces sp. NPDC094049]|uniref:DUF4232 domain-containing protein n=1 Tax=Streptomyces sp. NPDC094049 TaxID=3154987 RepID=UPI00332C3D02